MTISIYSSKEIDVNDIVEVLAGCSKELHSIDKECIDQITLSDLAGAVKGPMTIKYVIR